MLGYRSLVKAGKGSTLNIGYINRFFFKTQPNNPKHNLESQRLRGKQVNVLASFHRSHQQVCIVVFWFILFAFDFRLLHHKQKRGLSSNQRVFIVDKFNY